MNSRAIAFGPEVVTGSHHLLSLQPILENPLSASTCVCLSKAYFSNIALRFKILKFFF